MKLPKRPMGNGAKIPFKKVGGRHLLKLLVTYTSLLCLVLIKLGADVSFIFYLLTDNACNGEEKKNRQLDRDFGISPGLRPPFCVANLPVA